MMCNRVKQIVLWVIAIWVAVTGSSVADGYTVVSYDTDKMHYSATPEQAIVKIKSWTGDPNISLTFKGVDTILGETEIDAQYVFETTDGIQSFRCSPKSGDIEGWINRQLKSSGYGKSSVFWKGPDFSRMLPISEIDAMNREFLSTRFPHFDSLNMKLSVPNACNVYTQQLSNGVWFRGNSINILRNEETGDAFQYSARFTDLPSISADYTVSASTAETTALNYVQSKNLAESEETPVYANSVFLWQNHGVWLKKDSDNNYGLNWLLLVVAALKTGVTRDSFATELRTNGGSDEIIVLEVKINARSGAVICAEESVAENLPPSVSAPAISFAEGTYNSNQSVSLSCDAANSEIRYTLDGTRPTISSTKYESPICVDRSLTLKARAFAPTYRSSILKSATYTLIPATPTISPDSCANTGQQITLSSATLGAEIRYTTDGTDPTSSSQLYRAPFKIQSGSTVTVKAKAFKAGWAESDIAQHVFSIQQ